MSTERRLVPTLGFIATLSLAAVGCGPSGPSHLSAAVPSSAPSVRVASSKTVATATPATATTQAPSPVTEPNVGVSYLPSVPPSDAAPVATAITNAEQTVGLSAAPTSTVYSANFTDTDFGGVNAQGQFAPKYVGVAAWVVTFEGVPQYSLGPRTTDAAGHVVVGTHTELTVICDGHTGAYLFGYSVR